MSLLVTLNTVLQHCMDNSSYAWRLRGEIAILEADVTYVYVVGAPVQHTGAVSVMGHSR